MTSNHLLLYRIAELMLEHEQHVLPVDLLFDDDQIGDFVKSIQIDSPYQQMLLDGVLTESVKGEELYLNFTTEGYFHYILGEVIYVRCQGLGGEVLNQIMEANKLNGIKQGVEQCLIRDVQDGFLDRVEWLIDNGLENNDLCTIPLKVYLKKHGAPSLVHSLMSLPTSNDWLALDKLDEHLEDMALEDLRKVLHIESIPHLSFDYLEEMKYGFIVLKSLDKELYYNLHSRIKPKKIKLTENFDLISDLGNFYVNNGKLKKAENIFKYNLHIQEKKCASNLNILAKCNYDLGNVNFERGNNSKALKYYFKCLNIELLLRDEYTLEVAGLYNDIGVQYNQDNETIKSFFYLNKSLEIRQKIVGQAHPSTAISLLNLSSTYRDIQNFEKAFSLLEQCLNIELKTLGKLHPLVAVTLNNYGHLYFELKEFNKAIKYYQNCLDIRVKTLGINHIKVAESYMLIGECHENLGEHIATLHFYEKSLSIELLIKESTNEDISIFCYNIGNLYLKYGEYQKAIEKFNLGFSLKNSGGFPYKMAICYEKLGNLNSALDNYLMAAQIRKQLYGEDDDNTIEAFNNADRIKKMLY